MQDTVWGTGTQGLTASPNKRRSPAPNDAGSPTTRARLGPGFPGPSSGPAFQPCYNYAPLGANWQRQPGWQACGAAGPTPHQRGAAACASPPAGLPAAVGTPPHGAAAPVGSSIYTPVTGITPLMRRCDLGTGCGQDSPFAPSAARPWLHPATGTSPAAALTSVPAATGPVTGAYAAAAAAADATGRTPSGTSSTAPLSPLQCLTENPYTPPRAAAVPAASQNLQWASGSVQPTPTSTPGISSSINSSVSGSSSEALLLSCLRAGPAGSAAALPPSDGPDGAATRLHLYTGLQLPTKLLLALLGVRLDGVPSDLLRGLLAAEAAPCTAGTGAEAGSGPQPLLEVLRFMLVRQQQQQLLQLAGAAGGGSADGGRGGQAAARTPEQRGSSSSSGVGVAAAPGTARAEVDMRLRVRGAWDKVRRSGMVRAEAPHLAAAVAMTGDAANGLGSMAGGVGGRLHYDAAAPQRPPYRTVVARAELVRSVEASENGSQGRGRGGAGGWGCGVPVAAAAAAPGGAQWAIRLDLEVSTEGCVLTRHPLLAAHDRLLRLELADTHDLLDEDARAGAGGGGRLRGAERRQQLLREALAQLLGRGFVLLGRLYRFLMFKDDSLWCLAVRSARPADQAAWAPVTNPFRDAWPLLGAAGLLGSVQQQASRAELWASKAVPLPLHGWTVRYEPDPEGPPDPATGAPGVKLTDGAGRASPDLWSLIMPVWEQHRAAAEAVQDGAADAVAGGGSSFSRRRARRAAAYGAAASVGAAVAVAGGGPAPPPAHCMPVQVRLHHALLSPATSHSSSGAAATTTGCSSLGSLGNHSSGVSGANAASLISPHHRDCHYHAAASAAHPRVMAKGMLSPDARLPPFTLVLPYSCVKAPGKAQLVAWAAEAEAARRASDVASMTKVFLEEAEGWAEFGEPQGGEDGATGQAQSRSAPGSVPCGDGFGGGIGLGVGSGVGVGGGRDGGGIGGGSVVAGGGCSYSGEVQLELLTCGTAVREGRLNQNLLPLLAHHGAPRQFLYELLDQALAEVRDVTRSPAAALRALGGLEGRFTCLRERLEAGWGYAQLNAWTAPDAHLVAELQDLQSALLAGLRDMQIPLPGSLMAVGVPDHTALLPRRCVVLLDDNGRSVAPAGPRRCLLYRDPELRPRGVLAAWLVPPPPGLMAGWYAAAGGVRSALIMPVTGGESLAAEMAGGDYDGDMFHVITTQQVVDAVWQRLALQQRVPITPPPPASVPPAGMSAVAPPLVAGAGAVCWLVGGTAAAVGDGSILPPTQPIGTGSQQATQVLTAAAVAAVATPAAGAGAAGQQAAGAGAAGRARAGSYVRERERGSLWNLQPLEDEDGEARIEQMVHFYLHAQECKAGIGIFHTYWQRCTELAAERGGGVGGRLCDAIAGCYEAALDAKKHVTQPRLAEDVERLCKSLPDPFWCRKNRKAAQADNTQAEDNQPAPQQQQPGGDTGGVSGGGGGPASQQLSVIADLYTRIKLPAASSALDLLGLAAAGPSSAPAAHPAQHYLSSLNGLQQQQQQQQQQQGQNQQREQQYEVRRWLLAVDERLVRAAKAFLGGDEAVWAALQARCLAAVQREWSAPWSRHLARQEQGRRGGAVLPLSGKEAQRRDEEAGGALQMELVLGCRRALLAAARDLLPGRLQLGDTVDEGPASAPLQIGGGGVCGVGGGGPDAAKELDFRSRTTLATALYCALYNKRREEDLGRPARLRVVWLVAGAELNWAHWVLRHNGRVPAVKLQLGAGA